MWGGEESATAQRACGWLGEVGILSFHSSVPRSQPLTNCCFLKLWRKRHIPLFRRTIVKEWRNQWFFSLFSHSLDQETGTVEKLCSRRGQIKPQISSQKNKKKKTKKVSGRFGKWKPWQRYLIILFIRPLGSPHKLLLHELNPNQQPIDLKQENRTGHMSISGARKASGWCTNRRNGQSTVKIEHWITTQRKLLRICLAQAQSNQLPA